MNKAEAVVEHMMPMYKAIKGPFVTFTEEDVTRIAMRMTRVMTKAMVGCDSPEVVNTEALLKAAKDGEDIVLMALMIAEAEGYSSAFDE